ncbi:DegT/DnrJ/EryC1/StrS family aminotransferase [Alterisphingorhabdus coralli]|uniref:DegT/DnrJ/EryC1/StrS aminotransferase family protein n=1 Tax=Alterisphingorhabdus coralli TaxID=3071408 RepID=A0AA97F6F0_9SPHN|nr:DegT/DnrJ/EryC1/StrS aminotransferase family protein [Parasphingorhabdus sp. SCSIO 66989]WOE74806.1 DegT/DnrJ/EryC1/StrS aminotransferase family protein [Parasphingorhabdus sp. SCSIO 66989]
MNVQMNDSALNSWPCFSEEEAQAAYRIITSNRVNYWTGTVGRNFEKEFAVWSGAAHAIALANGTVALDLALKGLGIGHGDEVIVTPRTFIASVSSVVSVGAIPIFADVDHNSGNITSKTIAEKITEKTRAIIPVHLGGWPCDMNGIMALANKNGISVIEDCAQAHGAMVGDQMVGAIGHIGAWSFCQDKIMTTGGEGGMVTTNDEGLWDRMWSYKDHGKNWDAVYNREHPPGFRWLHESFGTNWRMLEVQAAIGLIQLSRMKEWTKLRRRNANALKEVLDLFPEAVRVPVPDDNHRHAYYRQYGYVIPSGLKNGWTRDRIIEDIVSQGLPAFQGSCSEVYREKAFELTDLRPEKRLPIAKELGETSLMFLTHPTMTERQLQGYCKAVRQTFEKAAR